MRGRELKLAIARLVPQTVRVSEHGNIFYAGTDDFFPDEGMLELCNQIHRLMTEAELEKCVELLLESDFSGKPLFTLNWEDHAAVIVQVKGIHHG